MNKIPLDQRLIKISYMDVRCNLREGSKYSGYDEAGLVLESSLALTMFFMSCCIF